MSSPLTGLRAWILQRVTAIYLGLFLVYLLFHFLLKPPGSFEAWQHWMRSPAVSVSWGLFFAALLLHAWVGIRDVILDYVSSTGLRMTALVAVGVFLAAQGIWAFAVLFGTTV